MPAANATGRVVRPLRPVLYELTVLRGALPAGMYLARFPVSPHEISVTK